MGVLTNKDLTVSILYAIAATKKAMRWPKLDSGQRQQPSNDQAAPTKDKVQRGQSRFIIHSRQIKMHGKGR